MTTQEYRVLLFYINKELYAIPLPDISEIIRPVQIRKVHKAPAYLLGIINFHGISTPVIDLKVLLGIDLPVNRDSKGIWIAVKTGESFVCLCVDRLSKFNKINLNLVENLPKGAAAANTGYIRHYFKKDNDLVPVIEIKKLLNLEISIQNGFENE